MNNISALKISISGRVQGVGFRPFVCRLANQLGVQGWVRNQGGQVEIHAEAGQPVLQQLQSSLMLAAPPLAQPASLQAISVAVEGFKDFVILGSQGVDKVDVHIPPDYFVCDDCLAEMQDPAERRYRYPFINCTQCGPRYTLIDSLPYDRPNTAMAAFSLCPACLAEYRNPLDRRYHAQPLACSACGPQLMFRHPGRADINDNEAALAACLQGLRDGAIIAVKGVGGYHLFCDASQTQPVARLRERKARPDKPLALLLPWCGEQGLGWVEQLADLDQAEKQHLLSPQRPIVVVKKRANSGLSEAIAPGLLELGLMLPYSPLHYLLTQEYGLPLVATSANVSGEPVLIEAAEVEARLAGVADAFLHHDRPIRRPADDALYRRLAGKVRPLRMGRGGAPLERKLPFRFQQPWLAVGADLKNTLALGFEDRVVISPHIGDLGSPRGMAVFEQVIVDLQRLYGVQAAAIVCDAHPGYHTQRWARQTSLPVVPVFHHHAHASALAGEHGLTQASLMFTWDGTGYGEDGCLWGGETLFGRPGDWRRVGSLKPFLLPGGDKASRQPWRSALSVCWQIGQDWLQCPQDAQLLKAAWQRGLNCPASSSAGRLFDAAAALLGVAQQVSYEGQAAMQLEAISMASETIIALPQARDAAAILISDWSPLIAYCCNDRLSPAERGSVFHASLAAAIVEQAVFHRETLGVEQVGLTGGVFQNRLLTEQTVAGLFRQGFSVYLHEQLPAGDGSISFGQLMEVAGQYW